MTNSSLVPSFSLQAYLDSGPFQPFYFTLLLCLYVLIVASNVLLIAVVCGNRSLHEPMYVLVAGLCVTELYGSAGLYPLLLVQLLSDVHTVSAPLCFLQVFVVHSYGAVEFLSLAAMSYDRYVAVCDPVRYGARVTLTTTARLAASAWLYSCAVVAPALLMASRLRRCGAAVDKVYCDMHSVVKLACSGDDVAAVNAYGLAATFGTIGAALLLILYSYGRILAVCFSGSRQTRQRAVSTCTPHLASVLNFTFAGSFEISQSRFDMSAVPAALRIFLSVYFLTVQPLFNPVMYGLKLAKIRNICKRLVSSQC
ncbi:olfactory receptor 52D1-like [Cololabis saira]|uniref:olfactory receptor 52D1-like n=1 Tax=Cololabis saira TaxID=129043 RepID=UPI002AD3012B|nr:olfactory receptor 52D1-like [Cololabis saira]